MKETKQSNAQDLEQGEKHPSPGRESGPMANTGCTFMPSIPSLETVPKCWCLDMNEIINPIPH